MPIKGKHRTIVFFVLMSRWPLVGTLFSFFCYSFILVSSQSCEPYNLTSVYSSICLNRDKYQIYVPAGATQQQAYDPILDLLFRNTSTQNTFFKNLPLRCEAPLFALICGITVPGSFFKVIFWFVLSYMQDVGTALYLSQAHFVLRHAKTYKTILLLNFRYAKIFHRLLIPVDPSRLLSRSTAARYFILQW